jgi:nucleoside-diphosphate-sugar epimerase/Rps23 Pro-64 3,4-dihydroxylase Tpa1-like proline 4-hydroxylase
MIYDKTILIIGGTGSLGYKLTERYLEYNKLYLMSRDESKHWKMNIDFNNHSNLNFIIGDIRNNDKVRQTILRVNPHIIILAAAMKHIDKCEYESNECIGTNLKGTQNVLDEIEYNKDKLNNLETVCFISTDKACSPVNIYGMTKAISESLLVEKSKYINDIKFVCVRYGNVLNSRGSIIPMLHEIGKSSEITHFKLTDKRMTRFVMTLEQSVDLIEHAIINAESGDIVIPKLISCKIIDLFEIFSELYNKPIIFDKLRPGEKMLESLINDTQSMRLVTDPSGYMYIKPVYKNIMVENEVKDYNSTINPLTKSELKYYLENLELIPTIKPLFTIPSSNIEYNLASAYPHLAIDNILPEEFAKQCQDEILNIPKEEWDRYSNPFEQKYTLRDKNKLPTTLSKLFEYLTSNFFVNHLSSIVGEQLSLDTNKNWWGVHTYDNNDYLDIHVDAGIHPITKAKKHVTLGLYLSKNWTEENGGYLEIWKGDPAINDDAKIYECVSRILPSFNKLILFTCNDYSWHGNPTPVYCPNDNKRIFVTLSFVSNNHGEGFKNIRQKAFFVKLPNEPQNPEKDKLRLLRADPEKYKEIYRTNVTVECQM